MVWYAYAICAWIVADLVATIVFVDRHIRITRAGALLALVTHALMIWGVIVLAMR